MDFREIKQFTQNSGWQVHVHLDAIPRNLEAFREGYSLDMDPDFQREHVWTEAQQVAFIEYILRGGLSGRVIYFNCPGFNHGRLGTMVLVDGKQRLEAIRLWSNDEIPACGCLRSELTNFHPMLVNMIFCVNDLETRAEVLTWYLEMNAGGTPHTVEELTRVANLLARETRDNDGT